MMVTGMVLVGVTAGCSSPPAVREGSVTACFQFAARAIQRHVTVTARPAACQGLSQVQVNVAVSRALRVAAAGVLGKVRQRQVIARDRSYVARLIHAVPASNPTPQSRPPGQTAVAVPQSRPPSRAALSLAALIAWLAEAYQVGAQQHLRRPAG